ncbi:hypothetical protein SAMN05720781_1312 [Fibrobacter sp. UWT3]|uniref:hypothetical protein n=1 Tax=Fibrobacter sp. UWT3 TaxID=1896225 RepID=UPI000BD708B1|nr:hypothetical protein [Fibrobacter sp. UWT3]SOE57698.1 hypothetical protein SAMN05720781_1312 [Fibrobacter sp. UWT3]
MNSLRDLSVLTVFGMLVACGDSSSPLPAIEESSSSDIPVSSAKIQSSSSEMVLPASSSDMAIPDLTGSSSSEIASDTVWNKANLTWYTSWPEPGSEECEDYNGCTWAGWFAGLEDQQTEEWVSEHNIIAVHEKDWDTYKLKTFRLRKNGHTIDAVVYDMCSDSDCDGCCTENAGKVGFLIDIESYTKARFNNYGSGTVEWTCLDCE